MPKIEIEINGKSVETEQGAMIIEAADAVGIAIPRFCYHKKLSIAANCRMCLVEVENVRKPVPACATPVSAGMKVQTESKMARDSQRAVMEFLLINHPLDCPVCDQGGECELQDVSMGYGGDISRYSEGKRSVADKNLGPLIATDMTRCIHCTRCVRFGTEVAGIRELGLIGRGENIKISTYVEHTMNSELSGNIIDLCPVGALTSKPFRFSARAWELRQQPTIAPHDCVGSHIHVHLKGNTVKRVVPRENEAVNEVWISDRDRFSYEALNSEDRARLPLIKENGQWIETDWSTALTRVADTLKNIVAKKGSDAIGALSSPNATTEEHYLLQRIVRGLGSHHIDHRLQQQDFSDDGLFDAVLGLPGTIADIEQSDAILLIGSHVRKEQPLLAHRIHKASQNGAKIMAINPAAFDFVFPLTEQLIPELADLLQGLAQITKAALSFVAEPEPGLVALLSDVEVTPAAETIAQHLRHSERPLILLGALAIQHPAFALLKQLVRVLEQATHAQWGILTPGANSYGAHLAGAVPYSYTTGATGKGKSTQAMLAQPLSATILLQTEPGYDCAEGNRAIKALQQADCVIALSAFADERVRATADIILPIAAFTETSGTYVNIQGLWQSFNGVNQPIGDARPAWKVLRVLGNLLGLPDFDYQSSEEVLTELRDHLDAHPVTQKTSAFSYPAQLPLLSMDNKHALIRIAELPLYASDAIVRRAPALQKTSEALNSAAVRINPEQAAILGLAEGDTVRVIQQDTSIVLPLILDARLPARCVLIPQGLDATVGLGAAPYSFVEIELYKV